MTLRPAAFRAAATAAALTLAAPAVGQDETAASAADPAQVVATVDGAEITLGQIILMRRNLPEQYQQLPDGQLYTALVEQAVNQALMAERGRAEGAEDLPIAAARRAVGERNFLAETAMRAIVEEATEEEALRALYDERYGDAEPTREVKASHILVETEALAEEIKAEIEAGRPFAEAAAEHGTDGTKERGGDLGWFSKERMVEAFAEAAFAAPEGEVVGPVETDFGFHLILVTGAREVPPPSFEEVRQDLAREAARDAAEAAVAEAREGSEVELTETPPAPAAIRRDDLLFSE
ncbi:MAG TPA: peptidylprolyl isomerase [Paracoccaceae bacterium]|nr:peptidylprolyl isomerase [Paracoccaceae bacterium]